MNPRYDEAHIRKLLAEVLGERYLDVLIIELPRIEHINLLVKTTEPIDWGVEYGTDDCAVWEYLNELKYRFISINPSTSFRGERLI